METAELISRVSPSFGSLGPTFYFTPETAAVGKSIGLDGFRFYFLGRGGVLGDADWPVVSSAFGYFKPSLVERMWTSAKEIHDARDAGRRYVACCQAHGRAHYAAVDGLGPFCDAAEAVVAAALVDAGGLPLFAGWAAEPLADDLPARAFQLIAVLRELRGSVHLLAVRASGLSTPTAHRLRRPDDVKLFGWDEGEIPEPTDDDARRLAQADAVTDELLVDAYGVLDDDGAAALVHGLEGFEAAR